MWRVQGIERVPEVNTANTPQVPRVIGTKIESVEDAPAPSNNVVADVRKISRSVERT